MVRTDCEIVSGLSFWVCACETEKKLQCAMCILENSIQNNQEFV